MRHITTAVSQHVSGVGGWMRSCEAAMNCPLSVAQATGLQAATRGAGRHAEDPFSVAQATGLQAATRGAGRTHADDAVSC